MFRIGQKVVCINNEMNSGTRWPGVQYPEVGPVYTVSAAFVDDGTPLIQLAELSTGQYKDSGFTASRFRPVVERKTDISIFTKILDDVKSGKVTEIA